MFLHWLWLNIKHAWLVAMGVDPAELKKPIRPRLWRF